MPTPGRDTPQSERKYPDKSSGSGQGRDTPQSERKYADAPSYQAGVYSGLEKAPTTSQEFQQSLLQKQENLKAQEQGREAGKVEVFGTYGSTIAYTAGPASSISNPTIVRQLASQQNQTAIRDSVVAQQRSQESAQSTGVGIFTGENIYGTGRSLAEIKALQSYNKVMVPEEIAAQVRQKNLSVGQQTKPYVSNQPMPQTNYPELSKEVQAGIRYQQGQKAITQTKSGKPIEAMRFIEKPTIKQIFMQSPLIQNPVTQGAIEGVVRPIGESIKEISLGINTNELISSSKKAVAKSSTPFFSALVGAGKNLGEQLPKTQELATQTTLIAPVAIIAGSYGLGGSILLGEAFTYAKVFRGENPVTAAAKTIGEFAFFTGAAKVLSGSTKFVAGSYLKSIEPFMSNVKSQPEVMLNLKYPGEPVVMANAPRPFGKIIDLKETVNARNEFVYGDTSVTPSQRMSPNFEIKITEPRIFFTAQSIKPSVKLKSEGELYAFADIEDAQAWQVKHGYKNIYEVTSDTFVKDTKTYTRPTLIDGKVKMVSRPTDEYVLGNVLKQKAIGEQNNFFGGVARASATAAAVGMIAPLIFAGSIGAVFSGSGERISPKSKVQRRKESYQQAYNPNRFFNQGEAGIRIPRAGQELTVRKNVQGKITVVQKPTRGQLPFGGITISKPRLQTTYTPTDKGIQKETSLIILNPKQFRNGIGRRPASQIQTPKMLKILETKPTETGRTTALQIISGKQVGYALVTRKIGNYPLEIVKRKAIKKQEAVITIPQERTLLLGRKNFDLEKRIKYQNYLNVNKPVPKNNEPIRITGTLNSRQLNFIEKVKQELGQPSLAKKIVPTVEEKVIQTKTLAVVKNKPIVKFAAKPKVREETRIGSSNIIRQVAIPKKVTKNIFNVKLETPRISKRDIFAGDIILRGESKYGVRFTDGKQSSVSVGNDKTSLSSQGGFSEIGNARRLKRRALPPNWIEAEYRIIPEEQNIGEIKRNFIGVGKGYVVGDYRGVDTFKGVVSRGTSRAENNFREYLSSDIKSNLINLNIPKSNFNFDFKQGIYVTPISVQNQNQDQNLGIRQEQTQQQNIDTAQIVSPISIQSQTHELNQEQNQRQNIDAAQIVSPISMQAQAQELKQDQMLDTEQITALDLDLITPNPRPPSKPNLDNFIKRPPESPRPKPPRPKPPRPRPPTERPPIEIIPEDEDDEKQKRIFLKKMIMKKKKEKFFTQVRRFGKFTNVAVSSDVELADFIGKSKVKSGLAASYRILKESGEAINFQNVNSEFYKSKRESGVNIQRRESRLSSFGERKEIKQAKANSFLRGGKSKWF